MDGFSVISFVHGQTRNAFILEAVVSKERPRTVLLQAFMQEGGVYPFPLHFDEHLSSDELIGMAIQDGGEHVRKIENWNGERVEGTLSMFNANSSCINMIRLHGRSTLLKAAIDAL
ncbi:hypothetical protein [Roseateles chitinivorans]|uniref:hypothetical protein n=1 Tax=Roseateles chitinivorans TaxID=2917965 RepID=UPI003D679A55